MPLAGVRDAQDVHARVHDEVGPEGRQAGGPLVTRSFHAPGPRQLWVLDTTDVFSRRIVDWNVASTLKGRILRLQGLDMAAWDAGCDLSGLTRHSYHRQSSMAMVDTDRVVESTRLAGAPETSRRPTVAETMGLSGEYAPRDLNPEPTD